MRFLLLYLFLFAGFGLMAQSDTEFWFGAPENAFGGGTSTNRDRPIYIRVSTFDQEATVTVSQPARPAFIPLAQTIAANSTYTYNLTTFLEFIETQPANTIQNYGLKIISTAPVTAYYEQASASNPDIFTLKGRNAIGTRFVIPSQMDYNNVDAFPTGGNDKLNSFVIVATQNNTTVTITPAKAIVGRPAGVPFTIVLNAGQTYSATATSQAAAQHLLGSLVIADKPIAVTVNDDSVVLSGTAADLVGDQIIPSEVMGKDYILVKGYLTIGGNPRDRVYIIADSNNTVLTINGSVVATLNALSYYNYEFGAENAFYLNASKPVIVFQLSGYNQQPAGAIIPPIQCTGSNEIVFTRSPVSGSQFGLIITTRAGNEGSFQVNPPNFSILASDFQSVPGTSGEWVYARKGSMTGVNNNVAYRVSNTSGLFHLGVLYGNTNSDARYGFYSNFATVNLGPDRTICEGDSTYLDAGAGREAYLWSTGATTHSIWAKNDGEYWVQVTEYLCDISDTIQISHYAHTPVNLGPDTTICTGETITFDAGEGYIDYNWVPGNVRNQFYTTGTAGTYTVTVQDENGCYYSDNVQLSLFPLPVVSFTGLAPQYCISDANVLLQGNMAPSGIFAGTGVSDNGDGTAWFSPAAAGAGGPYNISYTYTDGNECTQTETHTTTVHPLPLVSFSGLAGSYCTNLPAVLLTGNHAPAGSFTGTGITSSVNGTATFDPAAAGPGNHGITYTYTDLNGCTNSATQTSTVNDIPFVDFDGLALNYCVDDTPVTLTGNHAPEGVFSGPGITNTGNGQAIFDPAAAGVGGPFGITYTYTDLNGCINDHTKNVTVNPLPTVSFIGLDAAYCQDHPTVILTGNMAPLGTFTGQGITDNGDGTAVFDPAAAGPGGPYAVTYTFTDPNGCTNSETRQVIVWALPVVSFTGLNQNYCITDATALLTGNHAPLGSFSGTGITDLGNGTAIFDPALAGLGSWEIIYQFTDVNGCSDFMALTVNVNPVPVPVLIKHD